MTRSQAIPLLLAAAAVLAPGCSHAPREVPVSELVKPRPVFLLGFDGLDPGLEAQYEQEGLLPNFARLRERGAVGNIRSTIPMISPPAWTTVCTGVSPDAHGVWSFWLPQGDDPRGRSVDSTCRLAPAMWEDLTADGRTVGIVNVPVTSPPDSVNGFFISGFPYPAGAPLTYPPELEAKIRERGYLPDEYGGAPQPGHEEEWLDHVEAIARGRREVALKMLLDEAPDLSFIVFTSPDRIQHHLWRFHDPKHPLYDPNAPDRLKNAVRDSYVWCDDVLGEVLKKLPKETVLFVLSDHGFGPAYWGISKARVTADLARGRTVAASRNIFGGDFWLEDADDATRKELARELLALRDPRGLPLVREVHDLREGAARGWGRELGPDLVAEEAEGFLFVPGGGPGDPLVGIMPPQSFSGYHRRLGYFGAWGPPIVPGPVRDGDLADVTTLVMHILGEKVPRRYVSNPARGMFPPTYFVERPMAYTGKPDDGLRKPGERPGAGGVDAGVEAQLRALGYLK